MTTIFQIKIEICVEIGVDIGTDTDILI